MTDVPQSAIRMADELTLALGRAERERDRLRDQLQAEQERHAATEREACSCAEAFGRLNKQLEVAGRLLDETQEQVAVREVTIERLEDKLRVARAALVAFTENYVAMVNSGDCGNWNPEEDEVVIGARAALAQTESITP